MERVIFLLEDTGERISCLLNPESLRQRRAAGLRPRRSVSGLTAGVDHADQPLLFTGGGTTELQLDLLFDVSLVRPPREVEDVRDLTAPLWKLAENGADANGRPRPPRVRFLWGTTWNVPGVVAAVAERLESFTAVGVPRRSWMRMRFLRQAMAPEAQPRAPAPIDLPALPALDVIQPEPDEPVESIESEEFHSIAGGPADPAEGDGGGERLDVIAAQKYGDPAFWRAIAAFNLIADPLRIAAGTVIRLPPLSRLSRSP